MTIGELARASGFRVETIRYYEREGLLPRAHRWRDNNYRDFDKEALARLHFVRRAKAAGFTLREIRELLDLSLTPGEACGEVEALLSRKLAELDRRMAEMHRMRENLAALLASCRAGEAEGACPVLRAMRQ
ncbi:MAG: heavy metal-responsive transcriptional regulator [Verrucomicrobia bacterium]|nr:MAG: heavy metal-responsive transcriptional regulator [Verrucomicrobiota bacterium]